MAEANKPDDKAEAQQLKAGEFDDDEFEDDEFDRYAIRDELSVVTVDVEEVRRAFNDLCDACGWRGTGSPIAHGPAFQRLADAVGDLCVSLDILHAECWQE
jgi:hypothetical protein